jgi:hypothetical protein
MILAAFLKQNEWFFQAHTTGQKDRQRDRETESQTGTVCLVIVCKDFVLILAAFSNSSHNDFAWPHHRTYRQTDRQKDTVCLVIVCKDFGFNLCGFLK